MTDDCSNFRTQAHSVLRDIDIVPAARGMHRARDRFAAQALERLFHEEEEVLATGRRKGTLASSARSSLSSARMQL